MEEPAVLDTELETDTKVNYISELPDCILTCILSLLSMNDLLTTSALSKSFFKLSRDFNFDLWRDLKFDVLNVLGSDQKFKKKWDVRWEEYVKRVDKFIKNFKGAEIGSFLVELYFKEENSSTIDQWIDFAIARGVRRIDLLLLLGKFDYHGQYYYFPFHLFSKSTTTTLKDMHLRHCLVYSDISPFTKLRSLVLEDSQVDETLLKTVLHDCRLLKELSLIRCDFNTDIILMNIQSSSLCLLKLDTILWGEILINTPQLNNIHLGMSVEVIGRQIFPILPTLPQLEILNLHTYNADNVDLMDFFNMKGFTLKNLKQLHLTFDWASHNFDTDWLSLILQASPVLHKLSIMITHSKSYPHPSEVEDIWEFSHEEIKVVELGGCVGNLYEIEIIMNALKYFHKLEKIVLSPYWIIGQYSLNNGVTCDPTWFQNGRERIFEKLQGKGIGLDKLVLI